MIATAAETVVASTTMAAVDVKAQLEQRYIELLEKRVASLEALVNTTPEDKAAKKSADDAEPSENKKTSKDVDKKEEDKDKTKSRIRNVVSRWDYATGIRSDKPIDDPTSLDKDKGDTAFTFRRVLPSRDGANDGYCEADIESKDLQALLAKVVGRDYPGQNWEGEVVNIQTPFMPLVHYWAALTKATTEPAVDDQKQKVAQEDLARLLEHVKGAPELETYFKTRESNLKASLTTYDTMWSLFVPGQKIYAKQFLSCEQVFIVEDAPYDYERNRRSPPSSLPVACWCYDWNGKEMVKAYYDISIDKFRGTKLVNELLCYPSLYYKDENAVIKTEEALLTKLAERGQKYDKIVRGPKGAGQMFEYNGDALADRRNVIIQRDNEREEDNGSNDNARQPANRTGLLPRKSVQIKGKFIVDSEAFLKYGSGTMSLGQTDPYMVEESSNGTDEMDRPNDSNVSERDYYVLLPPRFLGYSTGEKFWGQFKVDGTDKVSKAKTSKFENELQLNSEYKEMINALVKSHESKNSPKDDKVQVKDVVEDKGKGLVILLHGPPGVGKTLTAETIAEATGKPLFIVSVAEIGLNASKAEKNLEQMFALAGSWEAVLLVDEADVFLETRTSEGDPNRNALVSVLLRVLEYYSGIMILTTNRITSLDIAVQSRIHLAIRFEDLTREYQCKIFKIFLDQLKPGSVKDPDVIADWIEEYGCTYKLNGRQIRNVVSSALALARSSKEGLDDRLTVRHLKRVIGITKDFQEQLESITMGQRTMNEVGRTGK